MPPPAKGKYPGVQIRGETVRVCFPWKEKRQWEIHTAPATPAGLKQAARDRAKIIEEIRLGIFDYSRWFPTSENVEPCPTVGEYAEIWLTRKQSEIEKSTLSEYVRKLNRYWLTEISHDPITLSPGRLLDVAANITVSAKSYNDSLTPLRQLFECAIDDKRIEVNPAARLKSRKRGAKAPPDPLTMDEQNAVLGWLQAKDPHWWPYFAMAFDTGMRTSELIALDWSSVDLRSGYVRIEQAYVRQQTKGPKTSAGNRDIEIGALTREALAVQQRASKTRKLERRNDAHLVFWDRHGGIINDDKPPRLVWNRALEQLEIRHRKAYATRHSFATIALMAGVPVGWISKQLGHSTIKQTLDTYATWIEKLDRGSERAKLDEAKNNA